jgi:hypothetical protein
MTRNYSPHATAEVQEHLDALLRATTEPLAYRHVMQELGRDLGSVVARGLTKTDSALVVSTVEDADFLTRGFLESLFPKVGPANVSLTCFWNDRKTTGSQNIDIAPILRRYVEPFRAPVDVLVVLKSIISGACVVRTNLTEVFAAGRPKRVVVAAPVILKGAQERLAREFDPRLARSFEYVYFAEDTDKRPDGMVDPGVGGEVYGLLGFTKEEKNRIRPDLIRERERSFR